MKNKHITILPNKFYLNLLNIYDLTFGGGGYVIHLLSKNINLKVFTIDKSYTSYFISNFIYNKNFFFFQTHIKCVYNIIKRFFFFYFNLLIYDQGISSFQVKNFYYKLSKINYKIFEYKIINLKSIFFKIIKYAKRKFLIIILTFNIYNYYKLFFLIKKIKKFDIYSFKPKKFEISLNNSIKNVLINYVSKK